MKKLIISTFTFVIFFASCSKEDTAAPTVSNATKTYWFDGVDEWEADSTVANIYTFNGVRKMDIYVYNGFNTTNGIKRSLQPLEMHCAPKSGAQTVDTSGNNAWLTSFDMPAGTVYYNGVTGNFNLTTYDTTS
jgi:hypothetical protein